MMYLQQGMTREPTYTAATQQLMCKLQPFPDNGTRSAYTVQLSNDSHDSLNSRHGAKNNSIYLGTIGSY